MIKMTNKTLKIKKRKVPNSSFTKKTRKGRKYNYKNDKTQKGGDYFNYMTVTNNGHVNEGDRERGNRDQCFWISLMDYFNNFRCRQGVTVQSLKSFAKFGPETDDLMIDIGNHEIRGRIEDFASQLGICIVIYVINEDGSSTGKSEDGTPAPVFMVNEKTPSNDVPIVSIIHFGDHFELILNGPNIVPLKEECPSTEMARFYNTNNIGTEREQSVPSEKLNIGDYQSHFIVQQHVRRLIDIFNDNRRNIISIQSRIQQIEKNIAVTRHSTEELNNNTRLQMEKMYARERDKLTKDKVPLVKEMKDKESQNDFIKELIILKKRYVELMREQSNLQANIALTKRLIIENETGLAELNSLGLNITHRDNLQGMYRKALRESTATLPTYEKLLRENISATDEIKDVIKHLEADPDFRRLLTST
jgi:hypothetical protein